MPQWIALLAIVVVGWLLLATVGGMVVGRGLRALERGRSDQAHEPERRSDRRDDVRRAA